MQPEFKTLLDYQCGMCKMRILFCCHVDPWSECMSFHFYSRHLEPDEGNLTQTHPGEIFLLSGSHGHRLADMFQILELELNQGKYVNCFSLKNLIATVHEQNGMPCISPTIYDKTAFYKHKQKKAI